MPAKAAIPSPITATISPPPRLPPTLVRVSRASQDGTPGDFFPNFTANIWFDSTLVKGLFNRASAANTSTPSTDGHYLSAARWNKIDLLTTNSTIPPPFASDTPDWVYVTRTGSRVCQPGEMASLEPSNNISSPTAPATGTSNPPASPVIGRYAFVIYDEGALLDINAAGATSSLITGNPSAPVLPPPAYTNTVTGLVETLPGKSYLADADLQQLPGLTGAQAVAIDPLGALALCRQHGQPRRRVRVVIWPRWSAMRRMAFSVSARADNPVLGRQDLINYFTQLGAPYANALPYFGTFSRAETSPSWAPAVNAGGGGLYNYASNAEVSTGSPFSSGSPNPNADLATARFGQ